MFSSSLKLPRRSDVPAGDQASRQPSAWTPEREQRAARLYLVEGFTAADVADALGPGFSRAAVIGKMRRLGCLKRKARVTATGGAAAKAAAKPRRAAYDAVRWPPQPLPPLREVGATGAPAPLACLPAGACRWPIDDPGAGRMHLALFCAGPAGGHPYCAAHRALATRRPA